jgi:hypothetical protein
VEVFVGLDPIDLRWGFDRLSGLVAERIGRDARCSALFVFFGKRRDALKVLFFDGSGLCLFYNSAKGSRRGSLCVLGSRGYSSLCSPLCRYSGCPHNAGISRCRLHSLVAQLRVACDVLRLI